jgi:hypothetical protein
MATIDASVQRRLRIAAQRPTNPDADVCLEAAEQITALQYALREALDRFDGTLRYITPIGPKEKEKQRKRIDTLRAQFLDDK